MNPKIEPSLPAQIKVSFGSAVVIGLLQGKLDAAPTTIYLMTDKLGKCNANCLFCPQARESLAKTDLLSRVSWPSFKTKLIIDKIQEAVRERSVNRVCIQALNYPEVFAHLSCLICSIREQTNVPISVSCQPIKENNIALLYHAGVERIGIPLDAATREVFIRIKGVGARGPYTWRRQLQLLDAATKIFGKGKVSTHLIVGLGETEEQMAETIQRCVDMSVLPGLFAFTPVRGTALEKEHPPDLKKYRRLQLARYLIQNRIIRVSRFRFDARGDITDFGVESSVFQRIIEKGDAFQTSGCPDCNRPFYNEKPSGPIFNYPGKLSQNQIQDIAKLFRSHWQGQ